MVEEQQREIQQTNHRIQETTVRIQALASENGNLRAQFEQLKVKFNAKEKELNRQLNKIKEENINFMFKYRDLLKENGRCFDSTLERVIFDINKNNQTFLKMNVLWKAHNCTKQIRPILAGTQSPLISKAALIVFIHD